MKYNPLAVKFLRRLFVANKLCWLSHWLKMQKVKLCRKVGKFERIQNSMYSRKTSVNSVSKERTKPKPWNEVFKQNQSLDKLVREMQLSVSGNNFESEQVWNIIESLGNFGLQRFVRRERNSKTAERNCLKKNIYFLQLKEGVLSKFFRKTELEYRDEAYDYANFLLFSLSCFC